MTIKFSHFRTHWNADEAHSIIAFLDELRDSLWETYKADIIEYHIENQSEIASQDHRQIDWLKEDGAIDF
jgi:hypothetical protein